MTNVAFRLEGSIGYGTLPDRATLIFDVEQMNLNNKREGGVLVGDQRTQAQTHSSQIAGREPG
jgi:hypothetical protein